LTGEGWGEGEKSRYFHKLFIPLPFLPSRQGRGNATFYEIILYEFSLHFFLCVLCDLCGKKRGFENGMCYEEKSGEVHLLV
jgi:hypothetical protein